MVEILVVIAIMSILAAIIIPGYLSVERSQRLNGCMNHLRSIGVALAMYHEDWGGYPAAPAPEYLQGGGVDTSYLAYLPFTSGVGLQYAGTSDQATPEGSLTPGGVYSGPPQKFMVKIATVGPPDQFVWSANNGATWSAPIDIPTITVAPNPPQTVPAVLGATGVEVTFGTDTGHAGDEEWTFWVGVSRVKQFGLATLYYAYLNPADFHPAAPNRTYDYVRSRNIYHCPAMNSTERVVMNSNLQALVNQDPVNQSLRRFDPLWAGYNTYDVAYNFDQFDAQIAAFDTAIGFGPQNTGRHLRNPHPPADTVVTWCFAHNRLASPTVDPADAALPDVVGNLETAKNAVRMRRSEVQLVLWVDGSVNMLRPYLTRARTDKDGQPAYFWTPPCLYSPEGGVR